MARSVPLVYTVQYDEDDQNWRTWKGGALTGRPATVEPTQAAAESYAVEQANKYDADGVVIQKRSHQVREVKQGPNSNADRDRIYRTRDSAIEVLSNEFVGLGWMISGAWDEGLLGYEYATKKNAVEDARSMMNTVNANRVIVYHDSGGSKEHFNPSLSREDLPF